jgi:hypothetical protein
MGRASGLIGLDQNAPFHRSIGPIHQVIGPPPFEGAICGPSGKADHGEDQQQETSQGEPAFQPGAACLAIAHAHQQIVALPGRNPKPGGDLAGKKSDAKT